MVLCIYRESFIKYEAHRCNTQLSQIIQSHPEGAGTVSNTAGRLLSPWRKLTRIREKTSKSPRTCSLPDALLKRCSVSKGTEKKHIAYIQKEPMKTKHQIINV